MLWGELTTDREDGYPRKYYELTMGKSLTFYVSYYGFLGTTHNARQKEARKRGRKKGAQVIPGIPGELPAGPLKNYHKSYLADPSGTFYTPLVPSQARARWRIYYI
mgnify:CR=1 FL=1